jgi:putative protein kinase ArgK-like GTPase of G3E family
MEDLAAAIEKHQAYLAENGRLEQERRTRLKSEVLERARDLFLRRLTTQLEQNGALDKVLDDLMSHNTDPATAAHTLLDTVK